MGLCIETRAISDPIVDQRTSEGRCNGYSTTDATMRGYRFNASCCVCSDQLSGGNSEMQQHGWCVHQRVLRIGCGSRPLQNRAIAAQFNHRIGAATSYLVVGHVHGYCKHAAGICYQSRRCPVRRRSENDISERFGKAIGQAMGNLRIAIVDGGPALIEFLDGWRVSPEYTFRQGSRRTWIVRAATEPHITKVQHDQGLAVVKEAKSRPAATSPTIEKFVAKADPQSVASSSKKAMPQSWASIVRNGPPAASATQAAPRAAPSPQAPQPVHSTIGLEKILASAIAAALQPFQEQFEKMQCAIVQLQEETQCGYSDMEFSDLEDTEEKSDSPAAPAASAPKKPRISKAGKVRSKVAK